MRIVIAILAGLLLSAGATTAQAQPKPLQVLATVGMIGDVAQNVGGACVTVTTMMGAGVDPHVYKPSARDVQSLGRADVIFYVGHALEGQLGEILARVAETKPTYALASAAIGEGTAIATADRYGIDPHLWMDASQWARIAPAIATALGTLRPECAGAMTLAASAYGEQLAALHGWVRESIASIPQQQRILVTAHDAFAYYGRAYGIEVAGIQGISTEAEAAIADIRATVALVSARRVPAIFVESTINARTIQAVIEVARRSGNDVRIGGELYSDAMGKEGTAGGTYIGMIYANTVSIASALGGTLPPLPDALKGWAARWNIAASR